MSTTIDQRVVEMRFDNKQFESATAQSISTIDKLKQKLNFKDSGKSLESLNTAAKKVDMSSLSKSVETVEARFSSLQVVAATALANITNSAINAGKNIVSALTIDPVISGFQEYETQINAIQTILANTQSKGSTLEDVTAALDELNKYADQTIYNFTEMTRNIGTFTAAGVDLDKSVTSIKGIANLAAISGSNAQQASTAMYQLSQALAAGKVSLMDWNSVVNAGMGGEVFQTALKRTATQMGYNVDALIEKYGSFRESLTKGQWLTAEVLTETLTQLSGAYTEADLIAQGYSESQAKEIVKLAETAVSAATDVKTFTQLMDTLGESLQSGWTQSWEIILGDFEEAKALFTDLSNFFGGIITRSADTRNAILEGALSGNPFSKVAERIEKVTAVTETMTKVTKDYADVVDRIIGGEFGNGAERVEALTKAGYDYAHAQNLVNERLGSSVRHATNYTEAQGELNKTQQTTIEDLIKMSDAQLVALGFTQDEVEAFRELEEQSKKTGIPINDLIKDLDQLNGRTLLINSFKNAGQGLVQVFTAVSDAWRKTFWGDASDEDIIAQKTESLYNMIAALHKFSTNLILSDETADKLTRTFQGLFASVDIVTTIIGGGFKLAFKGLTTILSAFDMNILDLTANLGDAIVSFRDWLFEGNALAKGLQTLVTWLKNGVDAVRGWVQEFMELPVVQQNLSKLQQAFSDTFSGLQTHFSEGIERFREFIDRVKEMDGLSLDNIGEIFTDFRDNVLAPLFNFDGLFDNLIDTIKNFKDKVVDYLSAAGDGLGNVVTKIKDFLISLRDAFNEHVGIGNLLAITIGVGIILFVKQIGDALSFIAAPIESFTDVMEGLGSVLKSYALQIKANALFTIAKAIVALAGAVAVLSLLDVAKVWSSVGVLTVLSGVLVGISIALSKFGGGGVKTSLSAATLVGLAGSVMILAMSLKTLDGLNPDNILRNLGILGSLIAGVTAAMAIMNKSGATSFKGATFLIGFAVSVRLLVSSLEAITDIDADSIGTSLLALVGIMGTLSILSRAMGNIKLGSGLSVLSMVLGLKLFIGVFDDIASMDMGAIQANMDALVLVFGSFAGLMVASKFGGSNMTKAGVGILAMSASLILIVQACKMLGTLDPTVIDQTSDTVAKILLVFGALTALSKFSGSNATKAGLMILAMSGSLLIISGAMAVMSTLDPSGMDRALEAIIKLEAMFGVLIGISHFAGGEMGTIIALSATVGALALALGALSFIDPVSLTSATVALSSVMAMFSLMVASTNLAKKAMGTLVTMTLVVGALGGILLLLSGLPVESTLAVAASLSTLLLSLSASMLIISNAGKVAPSAYATLGIMLLTVAGLAGILGTLAYLDVEPSIETATALSILLTSLSAACLILSAVGTVGAGAALQGALALDGVILVVGGLMAGIGALATYFPQLEQFLDTGIPILEKIGYGLGSFFGNIIGGFSAGATAGLPKIGTNLSAFMTNAQPFITGASSIDPSIVDGVGSIAQCILALTGANILDSIASWLTGESSLTKFAEELVPFGEAMVAFSDTVSGIDSEAVTGAATAGKIMAEMAATLPNSGGVVGFFAGENDMNAFADQLVPFGEAMMAFAESVSGLDTGAVTNAATAGKAMAEMAATLPNTGGVVGFFAGENDMNVFGQQLEAFGKSMMKFATSVEGLNVETVTNAATAGQAMAEMAKTLPNTGGVVGWFAGNNDMDTFGQQLVVFGKAIMSFSETVTGLNADTVANAATAGQAMVALAETIPNTGGVVSWFTGDNDIGTFGERLVIFGQSFAQYSAYMQDVNADTVTKTASAAESLVALAAAIPKDGWFSGNVSLDEFGNQLKSFGEKFAAYYSTISGISPDALSGVVDEIYSLVGIARNVSGLDMSGMSSFGNALKNMAKADIDGLIATYTDASGRVKDAVQGLVNSMSASVESNGSQFVSSVATMLTDTLTNIRSQYPQFTTAGQELVTNLATGSTNKKSDAVKAFEEITKAVLDAINQNGKDFSKAGEALTSELASGAKSKESDVKSSFTGILSSTITSIRNEYTGFYNAGMYLVQGFANGISENTYLAKAKAQAMANAAETAAKNALGIHSPSTVFEEIGENTVEGYEKGVAKKMPAVVDSGEEIGDSMIEATKHALDISTDSSKLAEEVIGESFVKGIADGITEDMSAEEAAEKKAQNIVTAFSNALEKIDLSSSTVDLKSQIWDALSENLVSEGQSEAAKLDSLLKEYEFQTQRLELAKAEYQTMVEQFGESSDNAKESYNKYLQEQLDLVNTFNEIVELKKSVADREGDVLDRQEEQLEREYDLWSEKALGDDEELNRAQSALLELAKLTERYEIQVKRVESAKAYYDSLSQAFGKDSKNALEAYDAYLDEYSTQTELSNELYQAQVDQLQWGVNTYGKYLDELKEQKKKNLLSEGLSEEEADKKIDSLFRDFNKSTESIAAFVDEFREIVTGSFAKVANDTTTAYMESVDESFGSMTEDFKQYGESYAEALNEGFKEGMASSNSDKVVVNAGSAEVDSSSKSDLFSQMQDMFSPITGESSTLNQDISSVFNNLGKNAMSEFVAGMQSEISDVDSLSSSVSSMIEQMSEEMQNVLGGDSFSAQGQMDTSTVPEMAQPLLTFFQTLAEYIRILFAETYQKTWFEVGALILTFIINGVEDTIPEMEDAVKQVMNGVLNTVLWFKSLFYQAGQALVGSILDGFKSEEYRFTLYAYKLGVTVGSALTAGFESGISSAKSYMAETGDTMIENVVDASMNAMDAHSPSRRFMKIGSYIPLGLANGIRDNQAAATNSAISMIQDTIARVAEAVDGGMDVEPTIRPVLDLSNVETGAKRLNAMFSRNQALSIDRSMNRSTISSSDQNGETATSDSGNTFNFTQNNYSPKSLSRVDIYRQTKNQFSTFQRMVRV